jgi:homoaconitase/3-isopropylmalate dehydratase large subunit
MCANDTSARAADTVEVFREIAQHRRRVVARNITQKLIASHLVEGEMVPGGEIGIRVDQTLTQDATGTMVMLELEAMGLDRVRTGISAQYVDHNLLQTASISHD